MAACVRVCVHVQVASRTLTDRLKHITLTPLPDKDCHIHIHWPGPNKPDTLRTMVALLRAITWDTPTTTTASAGSAAGAAAQRVHVHLVGWPLTHAAMGALQLLPDTDTVRYSLDLGQCTWPLPADQYVALAQHVPTQCVSWSVGAVSQALVEQLAAGINERRVEVGGAVDITVALAAWITEDVMRVGEHVLVRRTRGGRFKIAIRL